MKYVYIVFQKSFYIDGNNVDRMVSDCFDEPKVFSSFDKAKHSLDSTANYYTRKGWAGEWTQIPMQDFCVPCVSLAIQSNRQDGSGRYVFYITKAKVNYFCYEG